MTLDDNALDLAILTWVLDHGDAGVADARIAEAFSDVDWARRVVELEEWDLLRRADGRVLPTRAAVRAGQLLA